MQTIKIEAYLRTKTGKTETKKLFKESKIPGIIYSKKQNIPIFLNKNSMNQINKCLKEKINIIKCLINNNESECLIKDIKIHPVENKIIHIDLQEINKNSIITTTVPFDFINQQKCIYIQNGGILIKNISEIKIKGIFQNIPQKIEVDLEKMISKKYIYLQEIEKDKNFQIPILNKKKTPKILICYIKETKITSSQETKGK